MIGELVFFVLGLTIGILISPAIDVYMRRLGHCGGDE
jgi:hypothetical protein